jgi:hypothetical protein
LGITAVMAAGRQLRSRGGAWTLAGVAVCLCAWLAFHPGGGGAASSPTVIDGFMSAVQTPSSGEFPTPSSAVDYLVDQVRTQNLAAVTRVLPIKTLQKETFQQQLDELGSLDIQGFFPGQPLSELQALAINPLESCYTLFAVNLLEPSLLKSGTLVASTKKQQQALTAQLDPKRLSGMSVKSAKVTDSLKGAKLGVRAQLGIDEEAIARVVIAGVGSPKAFDFTLVHVGGNWLVEVVQPAD